MPDMMTFPQKTRALLESGPQSEHVAVGRITFNGGEVREIISVDRDFLAAALRDAIGCHQRHSGPQQADTAEYEAALAVITHMPVSI